MIKTYVVCDCCKNPLPTEVIYVDDKKIENVRLPKTKEWNTSSLFPHLCENCAENIDKALALCKNGMTNQALLIDRNAKINAMRRERLGSNG